MNNLNLHLFILHLCISAHRHKTSYPIMIDGVEVVTGDRIDLIPWWKYSDPNEQRGIYRVTAIHDKGGTIRNQSPYQDDEIYKVIYKTTPYKNKKERMDRLPIDWDTLENRMMFESIDPSYFDLLNEKMKIPAKKIFAPISPRSDDWFYKLYCEGKDNDSSQFQNLRSGQ